MSKTKKDAATSGISTKGTKYFGFDNVPAGVLVRAKTTVGHYEFYLKLDDGKFQAFIPSIPGDSFDSTWQFKPDKYTTGVYKAMH